MIILSIPFFGTTLAGSATEGIVPPAGQDNQA